MKRKRSLFGLINGFILTNMNDMFPAPSSDEVFNQHIDSMTKEDIDDDEFDWSENLEDMNDYYYDEDDYMDDNEDEDYDNELDVQMPDEKNSPYLWATRGKMEDANFWAPRGKKSGDF